MCLSGINNRVINNVIVDLLSIFNGECDCSVVAERLEDLANLLLDVSSGISRETVASRQGLRLPTICHREELR